MTRRSATAVRFAPLPATRRGQQLAGAAPQTPLVGALRLHCEVGAARLQGETIIVLEILYILHRLRKTGKTTELVLRDIQYFSNRFYIYVIPHCFNFMDRSNT